jgi:organic hydroperoxide reductase OsmC/OhrA
LGDFLAVTYRYEAHLRWTGSTGAGWDGYDREHEVTAPPAEQPVKLTTGESKGDPATLNPEQLLVMAASSCQMLWFLDLAAKARIDVVEYTDEATAAMPEGEGLSEIVLRPRIVLGAEASEERVAKLVHTAHEHCNIAASLRTPIAIEPRVEVAA